MTTETAAPAAAEVTTPDEFDKAFGEAITALDAPVVETKPAAAAPATEAAPATVVETKPAAAAAPAAGAAPAVVVETKPVAGEEVAPAAETAPAAAAVIETKDARQLAEEAARKLADEKTQREAQEKADREAAEARDIKDPVLTAEDTTMFENFRKEWPDVAKAVEKMSSHAAAQLEAKFARSLVTIVEKIYGDIAPLAQSVSNVEGGSFREAVLGKHPDYDQVFPKLGEWIAAQPPYLTQAYKRVYDEGNVQEVIDLVDRFKTSTGGQPQSPAAGAAPAASTPATAPAKPAASPATQAAAAALAPVTSKRSTPSKQGEDPNDFDGAFASAVAEMK